MPAFDKQDQFEKVAAGLLHGEQIVCVYDATEPVPVSSA